MAAPSGAVFCRFQVSYHRGHVFVVATGHLHEARHAVVDEVVELVLGARTSMSIVLIWSGAS